jgi:DNA recombination protein RmuC
MEFAIGFLVGALLAGGGTLAVCILRSRAVTQQQSQLQQQMRDTFQALASEALDANSKRLAQQTAEALDGRKQLIDQSVKAIGERLEKIREELTRVESQRKEQFGQLTSSVSSLTTSANELHRMLASTQRRGQWGERMAEDVLRLVGCQEGVNYTKQDAAHADSGTPDFTFFLPNDLKVNMDVKFPLERYKSLLDAETPQQRQTEMKELIKAVRNHIRAVAGRGYIDPSAPTVNYVLVFIPSEQIYSLVLQAQPDLIDQALADRVVLTSPLTLYAMLAVIRQAAENVNLAKTADAVLDLLGEFHKQWENYNDALDKLGQRLDQASRDYQNVRTTRTNMLERPLRKIEDLRESRGLSSGSEGD